MARRLGASDDCHSKAASPPSSNGPRGAAGSHAALTITAARFADPLAQAGRPSSSIAPAGCGLEFGTSVQVARCWRGIVGIVGAYRAVMYWLKRPARGPGWGPERKLGPGVVRCCRHAMSRSARTWSPAAPGRRCPERRGRKAVPRRPGRLVPGRGRCCSGLPGSVDVPRASSCWMDCW